MRRRQPNPAPPKCASYKVNWRSMRCPRANSRSRPKGGRWRPIAPPWQMRSGSCSRNRSLRRGQGLVFDTLYREGEWVAAGNPVVQLLPPENLEVRFFVPEPVMGTLRLGQSVRVDCDGCVGRPGATVTFISPQNEYTPPVIYSNENRSKLVFMVIATAAPKKRRRSSSRPARGDFAPMTAASSPDFAIDVQRPEQALRRQARGEGCFPARASGRDLRLSWDRMAAARPPPFA